MVDVHCEAPCEVNTAEPFPWVLPPASPAAGSSPDAPDSLSVAPSTGEDFGAAGAYLEGLLIVVDDPTQAEVTIQADGGPVEIVFLDNPGSGINTYYVPIRRYSLTGPWTITASAGSTVTATGSFT